MDSSTIAIVITVITIVSFILEKIPLAMTAMIASLAMGILVPEMKLSDIYSGFASNNVIMVAGMCIVGDALFKTGMANKIGKALGKSAVAKNERTFLIAVVICCTVMSAFLSNSGTIAMWMPLIAAVAAKSNGVIRSKMVILAAGIACAVGGAGTPGGFHLPADRQRRSDGGGRLRGRSEPLRSDENHDSPVPHHDRLLCYGRLLPHQEGTEAGEPRL